MMNTVVSSWLARGVVVFLLAASVAVEEKPPSASAEAPIDLSKVTPRPFDQRMRAQTTAYVTSVLRRERVPGASVAIVQGGRVVYERGFGVRELGKPEPVTPATLMMIGSVTKSMTTMMMATVVDDGKMRWDTPAVRILPSFA